MPTRILLRTLACAVCGGMLVLVPLAVQAGTTFTVSGTLSGTYPVSAEAIFMTSGSTLFLTLVNTSTNGSTLHPEQVLTSFYFDLLTNGDRVNLLACTSGSGNVYQLIGGGTAALPVHYEPPPPSGTGMAFTPLAIPAPSNILTATTSVNTWYFRNDLDTALAPACKFGIGTVGNTAFAPNGFASTYVDGIGFGIFAGDASDPRGELDVKLPYLVSGSATFTFAADRNIDDLQFIDPFVFGFGTGPAQTITIVPEPAGMVLLAGASLVCWARRWRRRWRSSDSRKGPPPADLARATR